MKELSNYFSLEQDKLEGDRQTMHLSLGEEEN